MEERRWTSMKITLKAARANKGLTLAEAAKLIGIDTKTLWNYEKANTYPEVPVIKKIEEVYGLDFKDINFG
jgi:putative transcriptional regulator